MILAVLLFCACNSFFKEDDAAANDETSLTVLSWNVQALFDGEDQGNEYDDYSVLTGWSREKYEARLNTLAKGIMSIPESPDIIGFLEIENAGILEDIVSLVLKDKGYRWTFFSRNPGGALGIGIISKYPFTLAKSHSIISDGEINPRPMAEVHLDVGGKPVVIFVCHWKSKLGDPEITEAQRKASARLALRRIKELETEKIEHSKIPIIVMGDLNENHDEFYRSGGSFITALLPDDEQAASLSDASSSINQDFFVLSRDKTQQAVHFNYPHNLFYTPWGNELQNGSYVYRDNWETIDHFLLRPSLYDGVGWDFASCRVVNASPFATQAGNPFGYNPRTGRGISDHLPLLMTMKLQHDTITEEK
jgi:endonuclease/exonuclease/phosphatase family metal-dependent hydrolase